MGRSESVQQGSTVVGIIGAGVAGASCARVLSEHGVEVRVYEKNPEPGGRTANRRLDGPPEATVDLGAQYFTVRDHRLRTRVHDWLNHGVIGEWSVEPAVIENGTILDRDRETVRYVGTPTMSSLAAHLLRDLHCTFETRVTNLLQAGDGWTLHFEDAPQAQHDVVVLTAPPSQSADLLREARPRLSRWLSERKMKPVWCYYALLEPRSDSRFDAAFVNDDSPVDWVARNSSKPGRGSPETWVVHAEHGWTRDHYETPEDQIRASMGDALASLIEVPRNEFLQEGVHRWRAAGPVEPLQEQTRREGTLILAGDWLNGARFEGAFLSGLVAANQILDSLV